MKRKNLIIVFLILLVILVSLDIRLRFKQNANKSKQQATMTTLPAINEKIDEKKFDNLYRAGKAIISATEVGVNYNKFLELVKNFASEISILRDKRLAESEQRILSFYEDALKCYEDSLILWRAIIEHHVDDLWHTTGEDENYLRSLKPMLSKYGIEVKEKFSDLGSRNQPVLPENSFQTIWSEASKRIESANIVLYK